MGSLAHITPIRRPLIEEIHQLELEGVQFELHGSRVFVACLKVRSSLADQIKKAQGEDPKLKRLVENVQSGKNFDFTLDQEGALRLDNCLCVPSVGEIRRIILEEAHNSIYTIHPSSAKINQDLKQIYWWEGMKNDVGDFMSWCFVCQQVKAEH